MVRLFRGTICRSSPASESERHLPVIESGEEKFISISFSEAEQKILAYVHQHGNITNFQCRHLLNLDYHHASYLLKKMSREGRLVRQGNRRGSYYQQP